MSDADRFTSNLTGGLALGAGAVTYGLVGALIDGAREARAEGRARQAAQVALANRRAAISARARAGVLRETAAELRKELAAAADDIEFLSEENARLRAALATWQRAAA